MGRNKIIRRKIAGLRRVSRTHHRKIRAEAAKSQPDQRAIEKWTKDIAIFEREIEKLEAKLPGGKR